jgi:4-amino-4-deoxy-L-arabinose transferase-like glycosyltransferase
MTRRNVILTLTLLSVLAFAARAGLVLHLHAWRSPNAMEHRSIAQSLVAGKGFSFSDWGNFGPTSVQSPPFPFLLAGMYEIFGADTPTDGSLTDANVAYFAIMMINALAGAALVWLTYSMARTLGGSTLTALLAAAAVSIWPSQVYAARAVQAISLITASLAATIILFHRAMQTGRLAPWIGYSIVATFATLTEPVFLPALAISGGLTLIWRTLPTTARLRNAAVLLVAVLTIIGPWTLRNRIVHGHWVPIKSSMWVNVWKGNNEFATGTDRLPPSSREKKTAVQNMFSDDEFVESALDRDRQYDMLDPSQKSRLHNQPEMVQETVFKDFALTWIKAHPQRYLELCAIRIIKTIGVDWDNPKSYNIVYIVSRYLLLVLTIVGLFVALRQKWSLLFPAIIIGTSLFTYAVTVTAARFSIPFEPIQLCLAAACIAAPFERRFRESSSRAEHSQEKRQLSTAPQI